MALVKCRFAWLMLVVCITAASLLIGTTAAGKLDRETELYQRLDYQQQLISSQQGQETQQDQQQYQQQLQQQQQQQQQQYQQQQQQQQYQQQKQYSKNKPLLDLLSPHYQQPATRHLLQQQCNPKTQLCGGRCVALSNPNACGPSCTKCPRPAAYGYATCNAGKCGISCASAFERVPGRDACRLCRPNTYKPSWGPEPCTTCPAGTVTRPVRKAAAYDEAADCRAASTCPAGQQPDLAVNPSACVVCPKNMYKVGVNRESCVECPGGSQTLGETAEDHDELADCKPGGLIRGTNRTGSSAKSYWADFEYQWERSLNNTGGRSGRGGSNSSPKKGTACLYGCAGSSDDLVKVFSRHVAHLAGSPAVYLSNSPDDVRTLVNLVSAVRDQGNCGTCVSHVIASAAESAAAAARRVDANLFNISHSYAYHCETQTGGMRSCRTGWSFEDALRAMKSAPQMFFMNSSCVEAMDSTSTGNLPDEQIKQLCANVSKACNAAAFTCDYKALSDGIAQVQLYIRSYGAVMTSLLVTESFESFFKTNPTGVFNDTVAETADSSKTSFLHAVLLVGYNNTGMFWLAKNSWGSSWGDQGLFRIAFGAADVAFPEDTYSLVDCFTSSNQHGAKAAWSDRWPVVPDPNNSSCFLYKATAKDTISGMADHFQVDILDFVQANTDRKVIPLSETCLGNPCRFEPQLQPATNSSWAGQVFQMCNIPSQLFDKVATDLSDNCTAIPGYCNGRATRCTAGKCTCMKGYSGRYCETKDNGVKGFTMHGKEYRLVYQGEKLSWIQASQQCQQVGMRLVRLYSRGHARELVHRVVSEVESGSSRIWVWIGLNARRGKGTFVWDSGTGDDGKDAAADFFQMEGLFPSIPKNASDSSCVLADFAMSGQGWIENCSQPHMYLCGEAEESSDPCVRHPCTSGDPDDDARDSDVYCSPSPPSSAASSPSSVHYNRTCTCERGFHYFSDEVGCVKRYNVADFATADVTVVGLLHRIFIFPQVPWALANRICCESGMKLVEIHNASHSNQLHKAAKDRETWSYWIGLNDRDQEGTFTWTSGAGACLSNKNNATAVGLDAASYTRWRSGEPNNYVLRLEDEDCAHVSSSGTVHYWNDAPCSHAYSFVCMAVQ